MSIGEMTSLLVLASSDSCIGASDALEDSICDCCGALRKKPFPCFG